jgi:endonuclease-3 related protein
MGSSGQANYGTKTGAVLIAIRDALHGEYGAQAWWPSTTGSIWEIMLGAVLTQRTTWTNVEKSLRRMVDAWGESSLREPQIVLNASEEVLAQVLRPTGFFASKPRTLKALARYVVRRGGLEVLLESNESTETLREELLGIWGIGPETADAILLYGLGRASFVADAYALRLGVRWGLLRRQASYDQIRELFTTNLPRDAALYNEYHALIVRHGKKICRPRPLCEVCPLNMPITAGAAAMWSCPKVGVTA